jgi:hypothetical protein
MIHSGSTSGNNGGALLTAALDYARRGWSIIPVRKKKAAGKWKQFQTGAADEATLRLLFAAPHVDGLAVLLGSASGGLVARDFDTMDGYKRWAGAHPDLAGTLPTVQTARGRHVYFRGPDGFHELGDGEYRGDSLHYCVLPPSRHPNGTEYRWVISLPQGDLQTIDPAEVGLCNRADVEDRADTADGEDTAPPQSLLVSAAPSAPAPSAVLHAIESTLPRRAGERNRRLFDLARRLKALVPGATMADLRPIIVEWHRKALPIIATKPFIDSWGDFIVAWERVKYPAGKNPVDAAYARAMTAAPPANAVELYGRSAIVLLAALCRELQRIAGTDDFFFLDVRTAGRLVGVDHSTAWRWLKVLCADGILKAGDIGRKATHKASRFSYLGD